MSVFGTRPEAIKMCPLVKELEKNKNIESVVCLTGQHKEMLQQVIDIFGIKYQYNLDIMEPGQTLTAMTNSILSKIEPVLIKEKPDIVLVHGDTTTSFAVALGAFYQKIPVGHIEAGLRTFDMYSPFPEEMNRTLTAKLSTFHFAPTQNNADNLRKEGINSGIFVTGNTVFDAFETTIKSDYIFKEEALNDIDFSGSKCILVTAHRRENLGKPLENICEAIKTIVNRNKDTEVVFPMHSNPVVQETVKKILCNVERVHLISHIDVEDMHNLIAKSYMVMTDSGGLQEEAPALGIPVLVLRNETERQEAVEVGTIELVGTDKERIVVSSEGLLSDSSKYDAMSTNTNPYGDGHASERIISILLNELRVRDDS